MNSDANYHVMVVKKEEKVGIYELCICIRP